MFSREWHQLPEDTKKIIEEYIHNQPIKLGALAKELGLTVKVSSLSAGISGEIRPYENSFVIKINRHEAKTRQRFSLAHEISHYLLHRDIINNGIEDDVLYRSKLSDQREAEANRLAADLIMPWGQIKEKLEELNNLTIEEKIEVLANHFNVSQVAMRIRLGIK